MSKEFVRSAEFLLGKVKINSVWADLMDKLQFRKDFLAGRVKSRTYLYNGIVDIETE
ncbi:MAG: hypothetical protein IJ371_02975 [Clostridia bacterium]|nr:hypothetical protein [Clostridia bacterium]